MALQLPPDMRDSWTRTHIHPGKSDLADLLFTIRTCETIAVNTPWQLETSWQAAQAITGYLASSIQIELDSTRRSIVKQIQANDYVRSRGGKPAIVTATRHRRLNWRMVQITPEMHFILDLSMIGRLIPQQMWKRFTNSHRAQLGFINDLLRRGV